MTPHIKLTSFLVALCFSIIGPADGSGSNVPVHKVVIQARGGKEATVTITDYECSTTATSPPVTLPPSTSSTAHVPVTTPIFPVNSTIPMKVNTTSKAPERSTLTVSVLPVKTAAGTVTVSAPCVSCPSFHVPAKSSPVIPPSRPEMTSHVPVVPPVVPPAHPETTNHIPVVPPAHPGTTSHIPVIPPVRPEATSRAPIGPIPSGIPHPVVSVPERPVTPLAPLSPQASSFATAPTVISHMPTEGLNVTVSGGGSSLKGINVIGFALVAALVI